MTGKRTILIAGMGTSPAVLTETVWALCHQKKPMVPDEIVVLVTKSGKERLCEELLLGEKSVWDQMLAALKKEKVKIDGKLIFGDTSIRVIPDERGNGAWDLRSGEDNLRAADFMLRQIRQYTESPDTVVLASIAGGRKTMSALLFSCMSLLGREKDTWTPMRLREAGVSERQMLAIPALKRNRQITVAEYMSLAGVRRNTATADLAKLEKSGVVVRQGVGRGVVYAFCEMHNKCTKCTTDILRKKPQMRKTARKTGGGAAKSVSHRQANAVAKTTRQTTLQTATQISISSATRQVLDLLKAGVIPVRGSGELRGIILI